MTRLAVALQGGGARGAFSWGVLDRIAETRRIEICAISGASAGALNAAVFLSGLMKGGGPGAQAALRAFWSDVSSAASLAASLSAPAGYGSGAIMRDAMRRSTSFRTIAQAFNPLRDIIVRHVDIEAIVSADCPRLFVSATNVLTARARVFENREISHDILLASACLPALHETVWVDGEPYWDGGFSSNPPLAPLVACDADRLLLVRLTRAGSVALPSGADSIDDYVQSLLFSRPLDEELLRIAPMLRSSGRPVFAELDATELAQTPRLSSAPTPRLVRELFLSGRKAVETYLSGAVMMRHAD